jgi:hypothetical protein
MTSSSSLLIALAVPNETLAEHNVSALVVPGVDGDVLGLRGPAEDTRRECAASIQCVSANAGVSCQELVEPAFALALARGA